MCERGMALFSRKADNDITNLSYSFVEPIVFDSGLGHSHFSHLNHQKIHLNEDTRENLEQRALPSSVGRTSEASPMGGFDTLPDSAEVPTPAHGPSSSPEKLTPISEHTHQSHLLPRGANEHHQHPFETISHGHLHPSLDQILLKHSEGRGKPYSPADDRIISFRIRVLFPSGAWH